MRPFSNDHPHVRSLKGVMSCEELRYWMEELYRNPAYGWAGHSGTLASAFGMDYGPNNACSYKGVFRGRWIYPSQQIRFSRVLAQILAGEIVCRQVGKRWKAVLADFPRPLRLPTRLRYNLATGRLGWAEVVVPSGPRLPSFRELMSRPAREWNPKPRHERPSLVPVPSTPGAV